MLLAVAAVAAGAAWALRSAAPRLRLPELEKQVARQPSRADLRARLAEALVQRGERFRGVEQFEVAQMLDPGLPLGSRLTELYETLGEPEAAAIALSRSRPPDGRTMSQARLELGDFRGALQALNQHTSSAADLRKARLLLLAGHWEAAAQALAGLEPEPEQQALEGFCQVQLGRPESGLAALRKAAQASGSAWNYYLLGEAESAVGDPARALQAWLTASKSPDAPLSARLGIPALMAKLSRWDQAEAALDQLQSESAEEPHYWAALALVEARKRRPGLQWLARGHAAFFGGDPWTAESLYRRGLQEASPPEPVQEVRRALYRALLDSAERRFDTAAAARIASEALRHSPREPLFLRRSAELLLEQNRYAEARSTAEALLSVLPTDDAWEGQDLLARIALESRASDAFHAAAERCRELQPQNPEPYLLQAEWRQTQGTESGRLEDALALYDQAVRISPDRADAHANRGVLLVQLRRWPEAISALCRSLDLNPRVLEGVPNAQLVLAYRRTGRELEARFQDERYRTLRHLKDEWANLLPSLRQNRPVGDYAKLGEVALKRHEWWIALCAYQRAVKLKPADPLIWEGLAAAEKRRGHFLEALQAMRKAYLLRTRHSRDVADAAR